MSLIKRIEEQSPEKHGLRVWYLGGNSLVLQSAYSRIYVDPFLVTATLHDGLFRRREDPPVTASEVRLVDGVLITHEHRDHCNAYTLREFLSRGAVPIVAPRLSGEIVKSVGGSAELQVVRAGDYLDLAGFKITVCASGDTAAADPVSFLIQYQGFVLYVAGDALSLPELPTEAGHRVDAAFLPIAKNPPDRELYPSPPKWAEMARQLLPWYAVPVHWDVWADYYFDPTALSQHDCSGRLSIVPVGGYLDLNDDRTG